MGRCPAGRPVRKVNAKNLIGKSRQLRQETRRQGLIEQICLEKSARTRRDPATQKVLVQPIAVLSPEIIGRGSPPFSGDTVPIALALLSGFQRHRASIHALSHCHRTVQMGTPRMLGSLHLIYIGPSYPVLEYWPQICGPKDPH